jgi:hypothetical protein
MYEERGKRNKNEWRKQNENEKRIDENRLMEL